MNLFPTVVIIGKICDCVKHMVVRFFNCCHWMFMVVSFHNFTYLFGSYLSVVCNSPVMRWTSVCFDLVYTQCFSCLCFLLESKVRWILKNISTNCCCFLFTEAQAGLFLVQAEKYFLLLFYFYMVYLVFPGQNRSWVNFKKSNLESPQLRLQTWRWSWYDMTTFFAVLVVLTDPPRLIAFSSIAKSLKIRGIWCFWIASFR